MRNPKNTFADITGQAVIFLGENVHGHFQFGNGSRLVTHVFPALEEAITRFGRRILTEDKAFTYSGPYMAGIANAKAKLPYAPPRSAGKQAVLEYGTGYLRGLIEAAPIAPRATVLTPEQHNAMARKAEGRK